MPIAAIYDPYLDTLGGGERYCLSVAEILLKNGWQVDLFWSGDQTLIAQANSRFSISLDGINIVPDIFGLKTTDTSYTEGQELTKFISHHNSRHSILDKYQKTKKYDLFFYLGDGSVPFLFSKKNIYHTQVPFIQKQTKTQKIINILKSLFIYRVIYNSHFTSRLASKIITSPSEVIYPPVDTHNFSASTPKENIILSVGRFDNILNSKKQDVLINTFGEFIKQNPNANWKLVLAGGSLTTESENHYLAHLKQLASGLPVEFVVNPDFNSLKSIYSRSKIYWHAAGYQVDPEKHPELCEHFGITPVEAMSAGLVPILINKGGLPEIIADGIEGFLWNDTHELLAKTQLLVGAPDLYLEMQQKAIKKSSNFSKEKFEQSIMNIISHK